MTADETVYVGPQSSRHGTYHLSSDCRYAPDNAMPRERATVTERMGLTLCKHCDPEYEIDSRAQSRSLRDLVNDDDVELGVSD